MSSKRQLALVELQTRLAGILRDEGYQTDAGQLIVVGEVPALTPDDPDEALSIGILPDEPGSQLEKVVVRLPIEIRAHVKVGGGYVTVESWQQVEAVISDIKTAVEIDKTLGGTVVDLRRGQTQPIDREPGSQFAAATVGYVLVFGEEWGAP